MTSTPIDYCKTIKLNTYDQITYYLTKCAAFNNETWKKMEMILSEMKEAGKSQLKLPNLFFIPLLMIYGIMIIYGSIGSFMVILVVAKNKIMRTPRNLFILNLAISDLILCSFTEPFNLLRLLSGHQEWNLGETICKLTSMLQSTNILVSTFSITAIALDRFQIIVHPERNPISNTGVVRILFLIWCLAIFLSFPQYFFSTIHQDESKKCFEVTESKSLKPLRVAHSYLMLVLQYVVPLLILSVSYFRICIKIKYRMVNQRNKNNDLTTASTSQVRENRRLKESRRQRRTNILLSCIAIIFALSWLPLNIVNLIMDFRQNSFNERKDNGYGNQTLYKPNENMLVNSQNITQPQSVPSIIHPKYVLGIQAVCLLLVLCSACVNPLLYGWLNENFKREFRCMFKSIFPFLSSKSETTIEQTKLLETINTNNNIIINNNNDDNNKNRNINIEIENSKLEMNNQLFTNNYSN